MLTGAHLAARSRSPRFVIGQASWFSGDRPTRTRSRIRMLLENGQLARPFGHPCIALACFAMRPTTKIGAGRQLLIALWVALWPPRARGLDGALIELPGSLHGDTQPRPYFAKRQMLDIAHLTNNGVQILAWHKPSTRGLARVPPKAETLPLKLFRSAVMHWQAVASTKKQCYRESI
jgi:hypothetical protein